MTASRYQLASSVRAALLCVAALLLSGCSRERTEPIRIGLNTWPVYELLHLAQERGFFKEEGTSVRLVEFSSLSDTRRALERHQLDGAATTLVELLQAYDNGRSDLQIILVMDQSTGGDVVLAQRDIQSLAELKGKRVGVEIASLGIYVLDRALAHAGLTLSDVHVWSTDQLSGEEALQNGDIDALVSYPPISARLMRGGPFRRLFDSSQISREIVDVLVLDKRSITERSAEVGGLLRAYQRAIDFMKEHPDQAYAAMARREQLSVTEFEHAINVEMRIVPPAEQSSYFGEGALLRTLIDRTGRILLQAEQIRRLPPSAEMLGSPPPPLPLHNP